MARVNWQGTEIQAKLIDQLPNGNYRMESQGHAPRVSPGTIIEVKQSEIVGLNIGGAAFLTSAAAPQSDAPPVVLTRESMVAELAQHLAAGSAVSISSPAKETITPADVGSVADVLGRAPKGKAMGTPLVEIKGLGNAINSVRSGLAGVRSLAADVQVSVGGLHAELTDVKSQIEDARNQIKTEASIMGNSTTT